MTQIYNGGPQTLAFGDAYGAGPDSGFFPSTDLVINATHTNVGTYTDSWTFTDPTGNSNNASGTMIDSITPATVTLTGWGYNVTYDGQAHTFGVGGSPNDGALYGMLTGGLPVSNMVPSADLVVTGTHTNAGTYTDSWTFSDPNYTPQSGTVTDVIYQANANVVVVPYTTTYNGIAQSAVGTVTGVNGALPSSDLVLSTTHTNAGTYSDTWALSDPSGNYASVNGAITDTINQGHAVINIASYSAPYDGNAHTATGVATGNHGDNLSSDLNLTATTHTNAGVYTDTWAFSDPIGNYAPISVR